MVSNKKHMSTFEKTTALAWYNENVRQKVIAMRLGVSLSSIKRLVRKSKNCEFGSVPARKPGSGPPKKVSQRARNMIKTAITKDPRLSSRQLKRRYPRLLKNISTRTIRRVLLKHLKLHSRVAAKKPLLTKEMKKKRMLFAKKYSKLRVKDWKYVLFTDESTFKMVGSSGGVRVRRKIGSDRYAEKYTVKTVKHSQSLMVWACFSYTGRCSLYFLPHSATMNAKRYLKVLKLHLPKALKSTRCRKVLQDKAPPHIAKSVQSYLKCTGINNIYLPGSSPDLNPIEHAFSQLKAKIERQTIQSLPQLKRSIKNQWKRLDQQYLKNLCTSMPRRLKAVLDRKGGMTKY